MSVLALHLTLLAVAPPDPDVTALGQPWSKGTKVIYTKPGRSACGKYSSKPPPGCPSDDGCACHGTTMWVLRCPPRGNNYCVEAIPGGDHYKELCREESGDGKVPSLGSPPPAPKLSDVATNCGNLRAYCPGPHKTKKGRHA